MGKGIWETGFMVVEGGGLDGILIGRGWMRDGDFKGDFLVWICEVFIRIDGDGFLGNLELGIIGFILFY